jgi:hypothetical protein
MQFLMIVIVQHSETGQRCPLVTIERRRNAPHAASTVSKLGLFFFGILNQPIWRIGYDGMD